MEMNKLIAAAALAVATLAAPVAPVQAATLQDYFDSCWFLPLLKDECAPTAPTAAAAPKAVTASVKTAADNFEWPEPLPAWVKDCSPAPEGSKYLLVCE